MRRKFKSGDAIRDTYTIVRHLGSGAFGDVYLARHRYMGLQAMKIFPFNEGADVLEEAYLLSGLSHPNIVRMYEANEFEFAGARWGYFTMEYVEGGTLIDWRTQNTQLATRIHVGRGLLCGLACAHSQAPPVIHRDISPSNVLIEEKNGTAVAKISDFGLARHVDSHAVLASAGGKYIYMAPEDFLGKHSTASDVYSAAIVLFELLTGTHPFEVQLSAAATSTEIVAIVRESRNREVPVATDRNTALSRGWNDFFARGLQHEYELRPSTGVELLELYDAVSSPAKRPRSRAAVAKVERATELAQQTESLPNAIALLEEACREDESVHREYGETLAMWKRGIVL